MNRWNVPNWLEQTVTKRDTHCVYCGIKFGHCGTKKSKPSWEHIVNDARIITPENISLCCVSCNSSKGAKSLPDWLNSKYCKDHNITKETVAEIVKQALLFPPSLEQRSD